MKHAFIILGLSALVATSCKKDRVCNCTVTSTGTTLTHTQSDLAGIDTTISTPLYNVNTNKITFEKVSKKRAKNNCFDKSEDFNEKNQNSIPGLLNISITNTGKREYDCKLE